MVWLFDKNSLETLDVASRQSLSNTTLLFGTLYILQVTFLLTYLFLMYVTNLLLILGYTCDFSVLHRTRRELILYWLDRLDLSTIVKETLCITRNCTKISA